MQGSFAIALAMLVLVLAAGIEGVPRAPRDESRHPPAAEREGPQTEASPIATKPIVTMPPRSPDSFSPNKQLATLLEPDMMLIADAISKAISDFITGTVPPFADMVSIVVVRFIMVLVSDCIGCGKVHGKSTHHGLPIHHAGRKWKL